MQTIQEYHEKQALATKKSKVQLKALFGQTIDCAMAMSLGFLFCFESTQYSNLC